MSQKSKDSKNELSNRLKTKASPRSIFRSVSSNKINSDAAYSELLPKFVAAKKVTQKKLIAIAVSTVVAVLVLVVVTVITFSPNATSTSTVVLPKDTNSAEVLGKTATADNKQAQTPKVDQSTQAQPPAQTQEFKTDFTVGNPSACSFSSSSDIGTAATLERVAISADQPLTVNAGANIEGIQTVVKDNKVMVGTFNKTGNFYMNSTQSGYTYCYQNGNSFVKNDVQLDGNELLIGTESI